LETWRRIVLAQGVSGKQAHGSVACGFRTGAPVDFMRTTPSVEYKWNVFISHASEYLLPSFSLRGPQAT